MKRFKTILKTSNNSSPGPDQIHYEILRHLPIETLHILLDIINETWKSGTFLESWREALIISIHKPTKDHFNPLNYIPIALTSCICKTVERMFNERLVSYLENNCLLAKQQCGFRSNRSTVDHLVRPETIIRDAFIQNQHLVAVFFDLQKAYDTTWKHGILQDLHDMGLRGNLPIFFTSIWWGSTRLQCIYYLRRILISRPPRVCRRFKRRSCPMWPWNLTDDLEKKKWAPLLSNINL